MGSIEHASAMPAPTWHFLNMNDATIEMPQRYAATSERCCSVAATGSCTIRTASGAFEDALDAAQKAWEKTHPAPTADELADREAYRAAEADATYGGTARSSYQVGADALEEARSLAAAFEHGVGAEAAAFLCDEAGERTAILVDSNQTANVQLIVEAAPDVVSAAAVDVIAGRGSALSLSILVDSPACPDRARGITGTTLRVFAGADARITIKRTQTLDEGFADIDDMGLFADDCAHILVRQTVLGGGRTFTGLAGDLRGDAAQADVDTRYLGHGDQTHDFNYVLRHHGPRTRCNLKANGVLAGKSSKTLRGTIDLVRGCKGAEGTENETVLLVDEGAHNKTVPVILCNEDDVAGNHGATIGHIRDEQLFYLASRGLSQQAAEAMLVGAMLEQTAIDAPDAATREGVLRLGAHLVSGFEGRFDEEVRDASA